MTITTSAINDSVEEGSLQHFAKDIENAVTSASDSENGEDELNSFWKAIIELARSTSFLERARQQKIIDAVIDLRKRTVTDGALSNNMIVKNMHLWSDLPLFGWTLRSAWNFDPDTGNKSDWINLNSWTARFFQQTRADSNDKIDFSLFGLWTIRAALEQNDEEQDANLAAAAVWLSHAADGLRELCSTEKSFDGPVARPGPRFADKQWHGFCDDRWSAWLSQLETQGHQTSDSETKNLVQEAVAAMRTAVNQ